MALTNVLFPIGPLHMAGETHHGVMLCAPGAPVETVWAADWDSAFAAAADLAPDDDWTVPPHAEALCAACAGRGAELGPVEALKLARPLARVADPEGFREIDEDRPAYALMRAMADLAAVASDLPQGRTLPVTLDITHAGTRSEFAAAISRNDDGVSVYVVQDIDGLRALIETSFGADLPAGIGFVMARIAAHPKAGAGAGTASGAGTTAEAQPGETGPRDHAIETATKALLGTGFVPAIRAQSVKGRAAPVAGHLLSVLTLALFRAAAIARGADVVEGEISLHDGPYEARMERISL